MTTPPLHEPGRHDLLLLRQMAASPMNVWRCWTEPDLLKQFFAPAPGRTTEAVIEPVPGGRFYTKMVFEEYGEIGGEGCILLAEPGRRLVFTDCLSAGFRPNEGGFFTADILLTAKDGGCEYRVIARHANAEQARKHSNMGFETGWGQVAGQLEALAAGLD
jgi:uncharacterized protein YndB with AHSA1/START domain